MSKELEIKLYKLTNQLKVNMGSNPHIIIHPRPDVLKPFGAAMVFVEKDAVEAQGEGIKEALVNLLEKLEHG